MKTIYAEFGLLVVTILCAGCATISKGTAQDASIRSTVSPDDDAIAVQGNWNPAKAELAGKPMADAVLKIISLKLDNGKYEVFVGGNPDRGTYTLDSATKPKGMTVTGTAGPNSGKTYPAIYELKGDTLCICYDLSGAKRPTEFKTIAGTRLYLATYNRKKE
jgi:uncharacterized protein (TIGR03067 family)